MEKKERAKETLPRWLLGSKDRWKLYVGSLNGWREMRARKKGMEEKKNFENKEKRGGILREGEREKIINRFSLLRL